MSDFRTDKLSCECCPLAEISFADCRHTGDCKEVIMWLDEHDKQIRNDAIKEMYLELANKYTNLWNDASDSAKNRPKDRTNEAQCGYECIEATWTMAISILNDVFEQLKESKE